MIIKIYTINNLYRKSCTCGNRYSRYSLKILFVVYRNILSIYENYFPKHHQSIIVFSDQRISLQKIGDLTTKEHYKNHPQP